jgi:hypothetical protein
MRIVPLARYLTPKFIYYGEVYRVKPELKRDPQYGAKLSALVSRILKEQLGYDFNARAIPEGGYDVMVKCGQTNVVCSTAVQMLNESLGIKAEITPSHLSVGAAFNIGKTGLTELAERGSYVTPTDIKRSADYDHVGTIDNNFKVNLVREWMMGSPDVDSSFGGRMEWNRLDVSGLALWKGGLVFKLVKGLASFAQVPYASAPFFWLANWAIGLNHKTLPKAPPLALASVVALNNRLEAAGKQISGCEELVEAARFRQAFDLAEWEKDPAVRSRVDRAFTDVGLDAAFK